MVKREEQYKPFFPKLFNDLFSLYSEAMTLSENEQVTRICLDKAHVYFESLKTLKEEGVFSPVLQRMMFRDIQEVVRRVNEEKFEPNRAKLDRLQCAFTFAASNLHSAFEPK